MLCSLLQESQGPLRRHVHQTVMFLQVMCSNCKRLGGAPAQGAAINALGCTGACLRWAARVIKNPPTFEDTLSWGAWHGVEPADVASFSAVCREVNKLGCAYLHWDVVNFHGGPGDVLAAEWLSAAHECYAHFLQSVDDDIVAVLCPDVPEIFKSLQHVHQNLWTVSSVVYTLHCEVVEPDSLCVRATTINGDLVSEVVLGREVPLNSRLEASSRQAKSKITARWKQAKSKPKTCEKQAKSKLKASCQRKVVTLAFAQDDNSVATHIRPYVRIRKKRSSPHSLYVRNGAMHVRQRTHVHCLL